VWCLGACGGGLGPARGDYISVSERAIVSLVLNFSPLNFVDAEVEVDILKYGDDGPEQLKQLRQRHWATHVFRRDGPEEIVAVPVASDLPRLSTTSRKIRLNDRLNLTAALIRNSLLNYLVGIGRTNLGFDPIKFIARDDLLKPSVPHGAECPDWLAVRLLYEIAVRPINFFKRPAFIAAVIDVRTTRVIDRSASQLLDDGFPLVGHYVTKRVSREDPRIAPHDELVGKVVRVSGRTLELTDSRDGTTSVQAEDVWLEKKAFNDCLSHVFRDRTESVLAALDRARADLRSGPTRLQRINASVEFLKSRQHYVSPEIAFTFTPLLSDASKGLFPRLEVTPKPVYIFDPTGTKTDTWHDRGLGEHGPYTAKVFTPNRPKLCVVCQRRHKGQVEQFLHKFINGIKLPPPPSTYRGKPQKNYFEKGFLRKYALQDVTYEFFIAEDHLPNSYKNACRQALEKHGTETKWDLALVQIDESFHQLSVDQNPYFIAKESFLTHQIPVQEFEIETAQRKDIQLGFCLNNMALATYAKMNGVPWLLKANPTIAHELVIGLGSAIIGEGRLGDRERYVGITTVFSGDGNYHLSNVSKAVPIREYKNAFLESLRKAINKVRNDMNWQPKDHVRLVFHATFKRYSQDEVDSVKALMAELGEYEVEYAFLQISDSHPYLLFDQSQKGSRDFDTGLTKGVFAPSRSSSLQLSNRDALLCLTGPNEVKRPEDGIPRPLLLSLHRDSSFSDMTYLTRQVFAFACHSWRTFLPASHPVTTQYSDLIARALGSLALLERWNPDVMLGKIGTTRWML
jgi:hypothetical protein